MNHTRNKESKQIHVDINISDILTQRTCGNILTELIKFLAYQKLQIPYSFDHLKNVISKKREKDKTSSTEDEGLQSQKYFRVASAALDVMDAVFKNLMLQLESDSPPQELCIVFGNSLMFAKEVYRVIIPTCLLSHYHKNHSVDAHKLTMKVMRNICFSQDLQKIVYHALPPTNMFVLVKQNNSSDDDFLIMADKNRAYADFFLPVDMFRISPKIPQAVINLKYTPDITVNCCSQLKIFSELSLNDVEYSDESESETDLEILNECDIGRVDEQNWFQATETLKGFKDCFVNRQSISDMWSSKK